MAKFVIAGRSDCPFYARVEILGDNLARNLSSFKIHKIVKKPCEWDTYVKELCTKNEWEPTKQSPIIWRELIDRGGKGVLIGGPNDFQEYANIYYGYKSQLSSDDLRKISKENQQTKIELDEEANYFRSLCQPIHICVTNATKGECYSILDTLLCGTIFGHDVEISIHLLCEDEEGKEGSAMEALQMEIMDCAYPLVRDIVVTSDVYEAFCDCVVIVALDNIVKDEDEDRLSYYNKNAALFKRYAFVANQVAKDDCKVIIAGSGPVNFNTYIFKENCTKVCKSNIIGVSRIVENHAKAIFCESLKVNATCMSDVIVWGNVNDHDARYIDLTKIRVHRYDGAVWGPPLYSQGVLETIYDNKWIEGFPDLLKAREETVKTKLNHGLYMSQAAAVSSLMYDWWKGCDDKISSMCLTSQGWYGVPEGLVFSLPVRLHSEGYWCVVEDIDIDEACKERIQTSVKCLEDEIWMWKNPEAYRAKIEAELLAAQSVTSVKSLQTPAESKTDAPGEAKADQSLTSKPSSLEKIVEDKKAEEEVTSDHSPPPTRSSDTVGQDATGQEGSPPPQEGDTVQ